MVRLDIHQKLGIAIFLCLSIFMVIIALIRMFGAMRPSLRSKRDFDTAWEIFWQHMEGCVAVLMGSITAFRNVFGTQLAEEQRNRSPYTTYFARFWSWLGVSSSSKPSKQTPSFVDTNIGVQVPNASITHATLRGLKTFIRRHRRAPGNTTVSIDSNYDPLMEYHNFQRQGGVQMSQLRPDVHGPSLSFSSSHLVGEAPKVNSLDTTQNFL
jgi:hypothetical protein